MRSQVASDWPHHSSGAVRKRSTAYASQGTIAGRPASPYSRLSFAVWRVVTFFREHENGTKLPFSVHDKSLDQSRAQTVLPTGFDPLLRQRHERAKVQASS